MRITDPTLRKFWRTGRAKGITPGEVDLLQDMLATLDAATRPEDMNQPGWRFHPLKGDRAGQYAVDLIHPWRLVFEWEAGQAVRVRKEDYHGK